VTGPGGIGDHDRLHPVGRLLAQLADLRGCDVLAVQVPAGVAAYPVRTTQGVRVLLARLGATPQEVAVRAASGRDAVHVLAPWSTAEVVLS
jgi:hypothetical protein